ncbi:hypothetical protein HPB52_004792 [Rhipicephalus sanguineus]|uniref:3-oxo-5-alpha-steroid 4-dehydrogenase C-terminal domain-containing protein n=1 Tax=Rhipicephalus sanguineus TaxID=34632 RepID=A0A9D4PD36_RHISA|nr:hypothetical protein HPB52_004792 [Rhipicephalus sanguineus]
MEIEVVTASSNKQLAKLHGLNQSTTILDVKKQLHRLISVSRTNVARALQVFLVEYFGPLALYLLTVSRPSWIYGQYASRHNMDVAVKIAAGCWSLHYVKRLLETLFVHRFSHGTMPITNLFKNCSYYWLFGLYIGYYVNHPLYTPPALGPVQVYGGLAAFLCKQTLQCLFEGQRFNKCRVFSGTKERRIPVPTSNPFTLLFEFVSCPNYTYEVMAWLSFTFMTQCLPGKNFNVP